MADDLGERTRPALIPAPERLRAALAEQSLVLDRELGRGGMSTVYLARDLRHDRMVAVKVLRPDVAMGAERFIREIKLVSPLVHPNIVPLYDSGTVDGAPYYVMPYIEGDSLRQRLSREGRLGVGESVRIAGEVAEALEFAHAHGIIHRDIKPENVLLQAGPALVSDFGVALALFGSGGAGPGGERLTESGRILGTAEYMSPEQASGDATIDGRSDRLAGAVALAAVGALMLHEAGSKALDPRRVVVARLSNETGDSTLSYLGQFTADRLTAALATTQGVRVITSATIIPSRVNPGLQVDSLDDPGRLRTLAYETAAGTLVSDPTFANPADSPSRRRSPTPTAVRC